MFIEFRDQTKECIKKIEFIQKRLVQQMTMSNSRIEVLRQLWEQHLKKVDAYFIFKKISKDKKGKELQ